MGKRKLFVYGASGHGKVVGDILLACKDPDFVGFIDDRADLRDTGVLGLTVLGDGEWLRHEVEMTQVAVALGVGDNFLRKRLAEKCISWGVELVTIVHPTASVAGSARLGRGTVVMAQAAINADAKIGEGAIVNTSAVVEHDVNIGNFANVSPNAVMAGASRLGMLSHLAIGASTIPCVSIGNMTIVGAGSVVVRDIPDGVVAFGVPARVRRKLESINSNRGGHKKA
jgi:sugar O-acyltransferase (sialic acid O-acetyltransferase NeuD family)